MTGGWRVYPVLARAGFRRQARYRSATLAGLCTNVVFGFLRAAVLSAAVASTGGFAGYDQGAMGAYVWLTQALLGPVSLLPAPLDIADRIKNGDIAVEFLRPVDLQLSCLASDLGRAAYTLLPRALPCLLVGWTTFGLRLPDTVLPYVLGLCSILFAVVLSFLVLFAVTVTGFWIVETRGLRQLHLVGGAFLAGLSVPVPMFPHWLAVLAYATPFPYVLQVPIDVLSGRITGASATCAVTTQLGWLLAATVVGRMMVTTGRRKLEIQGG